MKKSHYSTKIFFPFGLCLPQCIHFFWKSILAYLHSRHIHTIFSYFLKIQNSKNSFKNLILCDINDFCIILKFGSKKISDYSNEFNIHVNPNNQKPSLIDKKKWEKLKSN